jgi:hypothetical protein
MPYFLESLIDRSELTADPIKTTQQVQACSIAIIKKMQYCEPEPTGTPSCDSRGLSLGIFLLPTLSHGDTMSCLISFNAFGCNGFRNSPPAAAEFPFKTAWELKKRILLFFIHNLTSENSMQG